MAPEVIQCKEYNEKCDIWSAGVILYLLLAGLPPFYSANREETIIMIIKGELLFNRIFIISFNFIYVEPIWKKISPQTIEFIKQLICLDPDKRLTANEALHSDWIQHFNDQSQVKEEDLLCSLDRLRGFRTQMTFQKAVLAYMASQQLCQEEEKKLRQAFEALDIDKNGTISKDELIHGYIRVYKDSTKAKDEVERIMRRIDMNQNGTIDYNGIVLIRIKYRVFNGKY